MCSPVNFAGIWMLHSSSTTQSRSLTFSSAWIFAMGEMQREENKNVAEFPDPQIRSWSKICMSKGNINFSDKKKIREGRQSIFVVKRKMSLDEAMWVLTLKLKAILDICLTIPTKSTQKFLFFPLSGIFVTKWRSGQMMLCGFKIFCFYLFICKEYWIYYSTVSVLSLLFGHKACEILAPQPGIEPHPLHLRVKFQPLDLRGSP